MSEERQEINKFSPWWGEHIHRYNVVLNNIKGNEKILDIACGNGFGSKMLAIKSKGQVVGGDLSNDAIDNCSEKWKRKNLQFIQMDGTEIPFMDKEFDIVVSFETIEHTTKFNELIKEFNRVVKPNGIIYISTPNKLINSPKGIVINPFHTQEWYYDELKTIIGNHFKNFEFYAQKYTRYKKGFSFAKFLEWSLNQRGIRKLPLKFKDSLMRLFGQEQLFPSENDFGLVSRPEEIVKCKTFFIVCHPD